MMEDLQTIPGVGPNIAADLENLGIYSVEDLRGQDPDLLYLRDCQSKGFVEDKCQLYVFRCAVYFAETAQPEPAKLKWWYWKDKTYPER